MINVLSPPLNAQGFKPGVCTEGRRCRGLRPGAADWEEGHD